MRGGGGCKFFSLVFGLGLEVTQRLGWLKVVDWLKIKNDNNNYNNNYNNDNSNNNHNDNKTIIK